MVVLCLTSASTDWTSISGRTEGDGTLTDRFVVSNISNICSSRNDVCWYLKYFVIIASASRLIILLLHERHMCHKVAVLRMQIPL